MVRLTIFVKAIGLAVAMSGPVLADGHATEDDPCAGVQCLNQGWSDEERRWWYTTSQGSRVLPLSWFKALEKPGATAAEPDLFMSEGFMSELGYIPNPDRSANKHALPLGFAVDHDPTRDADLMCSTFPETCDSFTMREAWVGMNCAACHTNEIEFGEHRLRVEGAPTLADFQRFEEDLLSSLRETKQDRDRFDRFARGVLGAQQSVQKRRSLEAMLDEQIVWWQKLADKNESGVRYGHGRLDAQGHILNKIALTTLVEDQPTDIQADAPASYPFVWNTSQQGKIQCNGIASNILNIRILGHNTDVGALIRNVSEVIGVFAHIEPNRGKAWRGYDSSVRLENLVNLERQLESLQSPRWPEDIFGPIDWDLADKGETVFGRLNCVECHQPLAPEDTTSPLQEHMSPLLEAETDVFLACNTFVHKTKSGNFGGQKKFGLGGQKINKDQDFTHLMLVNASFGAIIGQADELIKVIFSEDRPDRGGEDALIQLGEVLPGVPEGPKKDQAEFCLSQEHDLLQYKARSLNGIWATAPYLHNGSVPTLYDLMLPARMRNVADPSAPKLAKDAVTRPEVFGVGSRVFDPVNVGFVTELDANPFEFRARNDKGEPIPGNFNSGHDYGTSTLNEDDRRALVEYLKTL